MGTGYWSSRPLLIALVLFAVLVVMVETDNGPPVGARAAHVGVGQRARQLAPRPRLPRAAHGGPARRRHRLGRLPRLLGFAVVGAVMGAFNPIGLRLVAYPLTVITHHQAFAHIVEWQSPSFSDPVNVAFLAEALLAMVLLVARRGTVEDVLVLAVFSAAALVASRNVPVAALVVTPVLARGLRAWGPSTAPGGASFPPPAVVALVALGVVLVAGARRSTPPTTCRPIRSRR